MSRTRVVAVIPARLASTRLPRKPLLELHGLPMIEHVRRRALLCRRFAEVVVATCDSEIAQVVERYGGKWVMTAPTHPAATDRVAEAAASLDCTHVVNVQGDEILILPEDLERMVHAITISPAVPAWNAVAPIEDARELADSAIVKGVRSTSGRILFCSRDFSSLAPRVNPRGHEPIRKILGILGYSRQWLVQYPTLSRTPLEVAEAIDQSRIIEHDVVLQGVEFTRGYPGINEPREVSVVERWLQEDQTQRAVLEAILAMPMGRTASRQPMAAR